MTFGQIGQAGWYQLHPKPRVENLKKSLHVVRLVQVVLGNMVLEKFMRRKNMVPFNRASQFGTLSYKIN